MWVLILSPLPGIGLHKTRIIEVVHPVERICRDENDTGISVDFALRVSKFDGL